MQNKTSARQSLNNWDNAGIMILLVLRRIYLSWKQQLKELAGATLLSELQLFQLPDIGVSVSLKSVLSLYPTPGSLIKNLGRAGSASNL